MQKHVSVSDRRRGRGEDAGSVQAQGNGIVGRSHDIVYHRDKILIKMDLLEIELSVVDGIGLAQDRYGWRALVNSVMNLRVP
jgi:hypothetical protein